MFDVIHHVTLNENGQTVRYIKTDRRGWGPTEVVLTYNQQGQVSGSTHIDLGYQHFWYCLRNNIPQVPFTIEDVVTGKHDHLLTSPV